MRTIKSEFVDTIDEGEVSIYMSIDGRIDMLTIDLNHYETIPLKLRALDILMIAVKRNLNLETKDK